MVVENTPPSAPVANTKTTELPRALTVKELAERLKVSPVDIIKELMKNGVMASINQVIDYDTAAIVASDFGYDATEEDIGDVAEVVVEQAGQGSPHGRR